MPNKPKLLRRDKKIHLLLRIFCFIALGLFCVNKLAPYAKVILSLAVDIPIAEISQLCNKDPWGCNVTQNQLDLLDIFRNFLPVGE